MTAPGSFVRYLMARQARPDQMGMEEERCLKARGLERGRTAFQESRKRWLKFVAFALAVAVLSSVILMKFGILPEIMAEHSAEGRFVNNKDGTVTDTLTGLMWADKDNGSNIDWPDAKRYCEGYGADERACWRMPTYSELQELYQSGAYGSVIKRTGWAVWASETAGSESAYYFFFSDGIGGWSHRSNATVFFRALPVCRKNSCKSAFSCYYSQSVN